MDFFKILKGGVGVGMSNFDRLFAEKHGGEDWQLTTLTGTLPLTFQSKGTPLTDYKLYGTAEGAGVETENLFVGWVGPYDLFIVDGVPTVVTSHTHRGYVFFYAPVEEGQVYCVTGPKNHWENGAFFDHIPQEGDVPYNSEYANFTSRSNTDKVGASVFTAPMTGYFIYSSGIMYKNMLMLSLGDKPLSFPYIPYGYKLPMTVESGEESTTIPIYIGDSKLMAEEYVDYESGKVYKRTNNLFNKNAKDTNNGYVANKYLKSTGEETSDASDAISEYIPIKSNTTYKTLYADNTTVRYNSDAVCFYDVNKVYISGTAYSNSNPKRFSTPSNAVYIRLSYRQANINIVTLYEGADSDPTIYQPYYEPTNPPVPLPDIPTYKGENTLSCSETLGEVSITGYIKEVDVVDEEKEGEL